MNPKAWGASMSEKENGHVHGGHRGTGRAGVMCLLVAVHTACAAVPPTAKMDRARLIQREDGYRQDGVALDPEDMTEKLSAEPDAAPHVSRSKTLSVISLVLATAGGVFVGWPIGGAIAGEPNPQWELAYVGGGAILVAIPFMLWAQSSMDSAVDAHNATIAPLAPERRGPAPDSSATMSPAWLTGTELE